MEGLPDTVYLVCMAKYRDYSEEEKGQDYIFDLEIILLVTNVGILKRKKSVSSVGKESAQT